MEFIVDFQGFNQFDDDFIIKELAIVGVRDVLTPTTICLFQAPYSWSLLTKEECQINEYLINHYHGIPWESGSIPYHQHDRILQAALRDARRIFVKGAEKKRWLQEILPNKLIVDLHDHGCPALKKLVSVNQVNCNHHNHRNAVCAIRNAYALKNWLLSHDILFTPTHNDDDYDEADDSREIVICSPNPDDDGSFDNNYTNCNEKSHSTFNQHTNVLMILNNVIVNVF